jgi:hypothetical protein
MITTNPNLNFIDIDEVYRSYIYPDGSKVTIHYPVSIDVSSSNHGGHRILDVDGISHYVKSGWIHLHWKVTDGEPNFSF